MHPYHMIESCLYIDQIGKNACGGLNLFHQTGWRDNHHSHPPTPHNFSTPGKNLNSNDASQAPFAFSDHSPRYFDLGRSRFAHPIFLGEGFRDSPAQEGV